MNNWHATLSSLGGRPSPDDTSGVHDFGHVLRPVELADGFVAVIGDQGIIGVTGEDAASFLHNQLTNDVSHLGQGDARLAGYCSPKGRLLASFLMWRDAETIYLQLARELQPAVQKRLSMFVLRAKAKLFDANEGRVLLGFGGRRGGDALQALVGDLPEKPYATIDHALGTVIRVDNAFGERRYQFVTTPETAASVLPGLKPALRLGGNDAWHLSAIHAGVPEITKKTQEQFVPQMVNFELLGGVNFKKGCYPGQEIVARSQYLGKLKRRTTLAVIDAVDARAGDEVFAIADPEQPCGMVVNAAPNGAGGTDALVEMKLASLGTDEVRLGSASGPRLDFQPMPYDLGALDL